MSRKQRKRRLLIESLRKKRRESGKDYRMFTYELIEEDIFGVIEAESVMKAKDEIEEILGGRRRDLVIKEI